MDLQRIFATTVRIWRDHAQDLAVLAILVTAVTVLGDNVGSALLGLEDTPPIEIERDEEGNPQVVGLNPSAMSLTLLISLISFSLFAIPVTLLAHGDLAQTRIDLISAIAAMPVKLGAVVFVQLAVWIAVAGALAPAALSGSVLFLPISIGLALYVYFCMWIAHVVAVLEPGAVGAHPFRRSLALMKGVRWQAAGATAMIMFGMMTLQVTLISILDELGLQGSVGASVVGISAAWVFTASLLIAQTVVYNGAASGSNAT